MRTKSTGEARNFLAKQKIVVAWVLEISEFNTSLLAKQVWRIHENPTSLCAQILKGIYYPHSDILNAGKGSRAFRWQKSNC